MRTNRSIVLVTLFCSTMATLGCSTWSRPTANVEEAVAQHRAKVQLTLTDGRIVQLSRHPALRGDSIVETAFFAGAAPRVFATSDVRLIQTSQYNPEKTFLVIAGTFAGLLLAYMGLVSASCSRAERTGTDC